MARRSRLVRKQSLFEKIRYYPFDLFLQINESRLSIDWDDYVPQTIPLGTGLTVLFALFCKIHNYYITSIERRENAVFNTNQIVYQRAVNRAIYGLESDSYSPQKFTTKAAGRHLAFGFQFICSIIFLISTLNAVYAMYFPYRDYTLLSLSADRPKPRGSHVSKRSISNANEGGIISRLLAYFEENTYIESESEAEGDTTYEVKVEEKDVWVLSVWDPSLFQLHLLATFSPVSLILIWLTSSVVALWKIVVSLILFNSLAYWLTTKFLQLISDKQIIYQETFNEYNKKYVIPKTSILKKNAIIDATRGPMAASNSIVHDDLYGHLQNDYTFYTHDIKGNRIKSVRADNLESSRSASPARHGRRYPEYLSPVPTRMNRRYDSGTSYDRNFIDDTNSTHASLITLSTPFLRRSGNDSWRSDTYNRGNHSFSRANDTFGRILETPRGYDAFARPGSRPQSPEKSPSRQGYNNSLSYSQRTQLSPTRSHTSRPASPQRSPSPSKRPWH